MNSFISFNVSKRLNNINSNSGYTLFSGVFRVSSRIINAKKDILTATQKWENIQASNSGKGWRFDYTLIFLTFPVILIFFSAFITEPITFVECNIPIFIASGFISLEVNII